MSKTNHGAADLKQAGMVSIIVTVILMFVISITVLGFAQIIRRSQREALDNQLSSQAFYAAESGINDVKSVISTLPVTSIPSKADCGADPTPPYDKLAGAVDTANNVSYTCLLIDSTPTSVVHDLSANGPSWVVPMNTTAPRYFGSFFFKWTKSPTTIAGDSENNCRAINDVDYRIPPASQWHCPYPMLRVDVTPVDGTLSRAALLNNTYTLFMFPNSNGGVADQSAVYRPNSSGVDHRAHARCHAGGGGTYIPGTCDFWLNELWTDPGGSHNYYLRISALYRDTTVTIQGNDGSVVPLEGAQVVVDATGKAQDVLRRIQTRISLTQSNPNDRSDFAIQSTDAICKQYNTFPGYPYSEPPGC